MRFNSEGRTIGAVTTAALFLAARAGPAVTLLLVNVVFGLRNESDDYLEFSLGLGAAALVTSLSTGWWTHTLVRRDPGATHAPSSLIRLQTAMAFGLVGVGAATGVAVFRLLGQDWGGTATGALATSVVTVQTALGATVLSRHQFEYMHSRLLFAEVSRSAGGLVGGITGLVVYRTGTASLLLFGIGSLIGISPFARVLPGFSGLTSAALDKRLRSLLRESLTYGYPIVVATSAMLVIQFSDRAILTFFDGREVAGWYSASYDLINRPVGLVLASISLASQRLLFQSEDATPQSGRMKQILRRDLILQAIASAAIALSLALIVIVFSPIEQLVVARLGPIVPMLAFIAAVGLGVSHTLMRPLQVAHRTGRIAWDALAAAAANLLLNGILIPLFGANGAGIATVAAVLLLVARLTRSSGWGRESKPSS